MALVLMCSASDTRHSPKACAKRWSRSSRASTSNKKSPRHFLAVLSTRLNQRKERAMRISAPTSSATTSGAIFTSRSKIHLFRIRRSVKSRRPCGSKAGENLSPRAAFRAAFSLGAKNIDVLSRMTSCKNLIGTRGWAHDDLVCRLLLEKKKNQRYYNKLS